MRTFILLLAFGIHYCLLQADFTVRGCCVRTDTGQVMVGGWGPGFNPSPGWMTWDFNGVYEITLPAGYNGVATPASSIPGTFNPPSRTYTNLNSNLYDESYTFTPVTFSVSGRVTRSDTGAGVQGVTFTNLSGNAVTGANGYYTGQVVSGFTGTIAPVFGYLGSFSPANYSLTNISNNLISQDFVWTPTVLTISGTITDAASGEPIEGVTLLNLTGEPQTDSCGFYSAAIPQGFSGTVRPWRPVAGTFSPVTRGYTNVMQNFSNQNYTWTALTLSVSGRITRSSNGSGLEGVSLLGFTESVITNAGGYYSAIVPYGFSGRITPHYSDNDCFNPEHRDYSNLATSLSGQNYQWTSTAEEQEIQTMPCLEIHPNPFRDEISIKYELQMTAYLTVSVYNLKGQKVRTLLTGKQSKGSHTLSWDGKNEDGALNGNGIYFIHISDKKELAKLRKILLSR
jgi:hypothetical protein